MKKVLAVDDQPNIIMLIKTKLKNNGYKVFTAYNGLDAIDIALSDNPDLILLDIMMPKMNGFEVFQKLKDNAKTSNIPVIFLTASGNKGDEEKANKMGASHFLTKPFSPKNLLEIVDKVLI